MSKDIDDYRVALGLQFKAIRQALNKSLEDMGDVTFISMDTLRMIEEGCSDIHTKLLHLYAYRLGMTLQLCVEKPATPEAVALVALVSTLSKEQQHAVTQLIRSMQNHPKV